MRNPLCTTSLWIGLAALTSLSSSPQCKYSIVSLTAAHEDRGSKPHEVQCIEGCSSSFIVHVAAPPQGHPRSPSLSLYTVGAFQVFYLSYNWCPVQEVSSRFLHISKNSQLLFLPFKKKCLACRGAVPVSFSYSHFTTF